MSENPNVRTWKKWYWLVAGFLALQIIIYFIITTKYS